MGALAILAGLGSVPTDAAAQQAVSALNGKLEFDAGAIAQPSSSVPYFRAAGSLAVPLSDQFGLQGDLMVSTGGGFSASGAVHVFTRDPASHLVGGTFGFARTPGATVLAAGPEAEAYYGRWSLEAWGGIAYIDHDNPGTPDGPGAFVIGDLAYYPEDNLRLSGGLSLLGNYGALHLGSEYLFQNFVLPMSLSLNARFGADGSIAATAGLKIYLGPQNKTLLDRHREDDPQNRGSDLAGATGGAKSSTDDGPDSDDAPSEEPPHSCENLWDWWDPVLKKCVPTPTGP